MRLLAAVANGRTQWRSLPDSTSPTLIETAAGHLSPSCFLSAAVAWLREAPGRCPGLAVQDLRKVGDTYHFSVTWPFCTRFMLKPTVGIELDQHQYSNRLPSPRIPDKLRLGRTHSIVNSPPCVPQHQI